MRERARAGDDNGNRRKWADEASSQSWDGTLMANVQMPRLSDSMETGKILRWLKKEGEEVKKGEPLVEIESDKANIEVEAYASGKLSKIVVEDGDSEPIGAGITEYGGETGTAAGHRPASSRAAAHLCAA